LLNTRTAKEAEKLHFWVDQFSGEAHTKRDLPPQAASSAGPCHSS
jgi:hypothetical protein